MKVYNVVDESYMIFSFSSVRAALNFTSPTLYNDRDGKQLTEKDVRKELRAGKDVYLYGFDCDGEPRSDWALKIAVNTLR